MRDCAIAGKPNSEQASRAGASSGTGLPATRQCRATGLVHAVRAAAGDRCKLHVLVRPRGGDFLYNSSELKASPVPALPVKQQCMPDEPGHASSGLVQGRLAARGAQQTEQLCLLEPAPDLTS